MACQLASFALCLLAVSPLAVALPGDVAPSPIALPPRPAIPIRTNVLSNAAFGDLFFSEIDLTRPDMAGVSKILASPNRNYAAAFEAWKTTLLARVRSQKITPLKNVSVYNTTLKDLMGKNTVTFRYQFSVFRISKDMGLPGSMAWQDPVDFDGSWNVPNFDSFVIEIEKNVNRTRAGLPVQRYNSTDLLKRWSDVTADFINNNWRIGIPLALNKTLQAEVLKQRGLLTPPPGWADSGFYRQQYQVGICYDAWLRFFHRAALLDPAAFDATISARSLAEMVYFYILWPATQLLNGGIVPNGPRGSLVSPYKLTLGVPNQANAKLALILATVAFFPEFKATSNVYPVVTDAIRIKLGAKGFVRDTSESHPGASRSPLVMLFALC
jgi:hypothetical protein